MPTLILQLVKPFCMQGTTVTVKDGQSLGRNGEVADIFFPISDLSRKHCHFYICRNKWFVLDYNSTNGTYLNGTNVGGAELTDGDFIRFGSLEAIVNIK